MRKYTCIILLLVLVMGCNQGSEEVVIPETDVEVYNWPTSTPEEQDLDQAVLENAKLEAEQRDFILSMVIVRNGYLVSERYFQQAGQFSFFDIRSVTKSFISALVGIALREGYIENLDERMLDFFPEYTTSGLDSRKYDITIRNLLTMSAGFDHETSDTGRIPDNSENWVRSTIELPIVFEPGTEFRYNSLETHLLSAIIEKASGMSTLDFANQFLFEPLKIRVREWIRDPAGFYSGGSGMFFTARDMARFGQVYLEQGMAEGEQVIPSDWVEQSTMYHKGGDGSWGELQNLGYGFQWWIGTIKGYDIFSAIGFAGQFIMILPELNMVIVTTAQTPPGLEQADSQGIEVIDLIANYILPAVKE